jgi:hypothetical protein
MTENQTTTTFDRASVRTQVSAALATVRATTIGEINQMPSGSMLSEWEQMAALSIIEEKLGTGPLFNPRDLSAIATSGKAGNGANSCLTPADPNTFTGFLGLVCSKLHV